MLRYLRLYLSFVRFSISRAVEFRMDFFCRILMDLVFYAVNIAFFKILFLQIPDLGGWSESQVMVFVASYLVADAIQMTVFANNVWVIPTLINRGDLDYYLVRPVSSLFFLGLRDVAVSSLINLACALSILFWALSSYQGPLGVMQLSVFALTLLNGAFIYFLIGLVFVLPAFWTHSARGFTQAFFATNQLFEKPYTIYSGITRVILTSVLPYSLMASFPARIIFEGISAEVLLHLSLVTVSLFALIVIFWNRGLRVYTSASS